MIKIINLTKKFNGKDTIFQNLNFTFLDGKFNFIMGKSGFGKTTLLNMILGLDNDYTGKISIDDNNFSVVFQEYRLLNNFSAIKNINIITKKEINMIINHLEQVDINLSEAKKPIIEFSGGMKQRVSIVRAIMFDSNYVIMDEPLKGLDVNTKEKVINYIKKYQMNRNFIVVTHDSEDIKSFTNKETLGNVLYL
ncbi:MAG: ATP-binding cassette domain-containing protein [Eubacteriales bacterium]|nr:ATP-binding cassette domain-containing protein [Eubacteriales bacterium]